MEMENQIGKIQVNEIVKKIIMVDDGLIYIINNKKNLIQLYFKK